MKTLESQTISFLSEQDGDVEREFKESVCQILLNSEKHIRAYLTRVKYEGSNDAFNVALCFRVKTGIDELILNQSTKIFKSLFSYKEHLDVIFINDKQEDDLRKICCPFFTSSNYQVNVPDFFLFSTESDKLNNNIACFKNKKLHGEHPEGYLLCDIKPPIIGQYYGMGCNDIQQVVLASRHQGYFLFPIKEWPAYVHVAIPLIDLKCTNYINKANMKHIAWAELYRYEEDIKYVK